MTAVRTVAPRMIGKHRFHSIDTANGASDLNASLPDFTEFCKNISEVPPNNMREMMADLLWIKDTNGDRTLRVSTSTSARGSQTSTELVSLAKDFPQAIYDVLERLRKASRECTEMLNTSQLALKDYWWNPSVASPPKRDPTQHSRLHHSVGFLRVADAWFGWLQKKRFLVSTTRSDADSGALLSILRFGSILHDIGHAPFSHLLEEVFQELHWSITPETRYTHEQLTTIRIWSLLGSKNGDFEMLTRLLAGNTGIHWLDAIVNSPFDADKIDYVFRDQVWLDIGGREDENVEWLSEFVGGQHISPQGQIFLNGGSAAAAYRLLVERCHLYDTLYYCPKVRTMERIVRFILSSFFIEEESTRVVDVAIKICQSSPVENENQDDLFHNDFVKRICQTLKAGGGAGERTSREIEFIRGFGEYLTRSSSQGECSGTLSDLGAIKVAFALAELYRFVGEHYPNVTNAKQWHEYRNSTEMMQCVDCIKHPLVQLLDRRGLPEVAEAQIIAEIGFWALHKHESHFISLEKLDENSMAKCTHFLDIADACALVLDPGMVMCDASKSSERVYEDSDVKAGRWLDQVLEKHCIGGPYLLRAPASCGDVHAAEDWLDRRKEEIVEIGRQMTFEYPGRLLVDVTGPLKVRTYPRERVLHGTSGQPVVCDQFWVPRGDPQSWSVRSKAEVPLSTVDFRRSVPQAYKLRVVLIDASTRRQDGREAMVDRFRKACRDRGIRLEEINNEDQ